MANITLREPDGPYHCSIDTDVMNVEIRNAFLGVEFVTEGGAILAVSMRDDGFEVHYHGQTDGFYFDSGWIECKGQVINRKFSGMDNPPDEVFLKAISEDDDSN
jgi:hypothetical protein